MISQRIFAFVRHASKTIPQLTLKSYPKSVSTIVSPRYFSKSLNSEFFEIFFNKY